MNLTKYSRILKSAIFILLIFILAVVLRPEKDIPYTDNWRYHAVITDKNGILPWYDPSDLGNSYDYIMNCVWHFWKNMPTTENGYKEYLQYNVEGSGSLGGDQIAMAMSSWRLYYVYTGDSSLIDNMKYMADVYIAKGLTPSNYDWPNITYPCNTTGDVISPLVYDGDLTAGLGIIQPDKAGSFAYELVMLYEMTGNSKYLTIAAKMADTLANKVQTGDRRHSPLPFKVNAKTGVVYESDGYTYSYTSNWVPTIMLFDELDKLGKGNYKNQILKIKSWLKNVAISNNDYGPFFEDVQGYSNTSINALTLAMYIIEQGDKWGSEWEKDANNILTWTYKEFGKPIGYNGVNYKKRYNVVPISEQTACDIEGNSHTARYASVALLYGEKTGDNMRKAMAIKQLSWATYTVESNGRNMFPNNMGVWLTDGYGDYIRHYLRSMGACPELAPNNGNHILSTSGTTVKDDVRYVKNTISYETYWPSSTDVLKVAFDVASVTAGGVTLPRLSDKSELNYHQGYTFNSPGDAPNVLRIRHNNSGNIIVKGTYRN